MPATLDAALDRQLFANANAASRPAWLKFLRTSGTTTLDFLFPPHCAACEAPLPEMGNKALCRECAIRINWIATDRCARCGAGTGQGSGVVKSCPLCHSIPPAHIKAACALARLYDGPTREMILSLKFGGKLHLAKLYGELLAERVQAAQMFSPEMIVVPTPITRRTMKTRTYNQSEEIAACLARRLGLKLETRLLKKIRHTLPQAMLETEEQRRSNLRDAFACDPRRAARHKDACVLLVDDVITTCTTVSECARTLVAAGIGEVRAAAIARTQYTP